MADKIKLTSTEQELYDSLKRLVSESQDFFARHSRDYEEQSCRDNEMAMKAHELHESLKSNGHEPIHHQYMYKNRGVPVDTVEFYNHLHPVEDLLSFIEDPDSTKDPEDTTIGVEFEFEIYTRRWGHTDFYALTRTETGWRITGASAFNNNETDKSGQPGVFSALQHDSVSYPYNIGLLLEWTWDKASEGATREEVQAAINDIAKWISLCEKNTPRGMFKELL